MLAVNKLSILIVSNVFIVKVQRNLKMKMEAQGRYLERIAEEHKSRPDNNGKPRKSSSPISLPCLCKESESESYSDIEKLDIRSDEKFQGSKRAHVDQEDVLPRRHKNFAAGYCAQQCMFVPKG